MKRLFYFTCWSIFLFLIYCSSGTDSDDKSPRSYDWTLDTLDNFGALQSDMSSIWGSSPDNVYTAGHSSGSDIGRMFHYNGKAWEAVLDIEDYAGYMIGEMLGFGDDNIWLCGREGGTANFFYFNGNKWRPVKVSVDGSLESIGGEYPNNFWAGGYNVLLKYSNGQWESQPLEFPGARTGEYFIRDIEGNGEHGLYLALEVREPSDISYFYLYRQEADQWQMVLDSGSYPRYYKLWLSPTGILYLSGHTAYKLVNNTLTELDGLDRSLKAFFIFGTSDQSIFVSGKISDTTKFYHYNGSNWHEYKELATDALVWPARSWAGGNEVFFIGNTRDRRTVIYHGK